MRIFTEPESIIRYAQWRREGSYKSGKALEAHALSAHNGIVDKKCNACKELLKKQKEANK